MNDQAPGRCVVLLRGVNVGPHKRIGMADFRRVLEGLGCQDVETYLQSGNAAVTVNETASLAARVHEALRRDLDLDVAVVVRTAAELADVVRRNPFPGRVGQPKRLHVAFLATQPDPAAVLALGRKHGDDEIVVAEGAAYLSYAGGSVKSPLEAALPKLGVVMTARNWTTVLALAELAKSG